MPVQFLFRGKPDQVEFDLSDDQDSRYQVQGVQLLRQAKVKLGEEEKEFNWVVKFGFKDRATGKDVQHEIGTYTVILPVMGSALWYYNEALKMPLKKLPYNKQDGKAKVTLSAGDPAMGWT